MRIRGIAVVNRERAEELRFLNNNLPDCRRDRRRWEGHSLRESAPRSPHCSCPAGTESYDTFQRSYMSQVHVYLGLHGGFLLPVSPAPPGTHLQVTCASSGGLRCVAATTEFWESTCARAAEGRIHARRYWSESAECWQETVITIIKHAFGPHWEGWSCPVTFRLNSPWTIDGSSRGRAGALTSVIELQLEG